MERTMYEYGCFDGVYEYSGNEIDEYRSTINFAKKYIPGGKPFVMRNTKLYYLDINGAFAASANGIPYTIDPDSERNDKINTLFKRMYEGRMRLKKAGMRIEETIKKLMVTVYGNSIIKQKRFKTIFPKDIHKNIDYNGKHVVKYNDESVTIKRCFNPHFYWGQYAKTMLDNYHSKMKKISEIVDILFCNIDSILVSEQDYLKLKQLGYISQDEFGKFKKDKVFTNFAIKSAAKWFGVLEDGTEIRRPKDFKMSFEEFVENI